MAPKYTASSGKTRRLFTKAEIAKHLTAYHSSGDTINAYAHDNGFAHGTLKRWIEKYPKPKKSASVTAGAFSGSVEGSASEPLPALIGGAPRLAKAGKGAPSKAEGVVDRRLRSIATLSKPAGAGRLSLESLEVLSKSQQVENQALRDVLASTQALCNVYQRQAAMALTP